jgi:hypothetical protein
MSFKEGLQKFNETLTKVISYVPNRIAGEVNHSSAALTNVAMGRGTPEDVSTLAQTAGVVAAAVATDGATEVEAVVVTASRRGAAAEAGAAGDALSGFRYASRVRDRALQDPVSHNFPYSYDEGILQTPPIQRPNGYNLFRKPGSMNDKNGVFEIGVDKDGVIDHRFFRPGK